MVRDLGIGRGSVAHLAGGAGGAVGEGPRHRAVPDHHDRDDDDHRAVMNDDDNDVLPVYGDDHQVPHRGVARQVVDGQPGVAQVAGKRPLLQKG